jgi:hypothetical protein
MPYISKAERIRFELAITTARGALAATHHVPGNLNYLLTRICDDYAHLKVVPSYAELAEVIETLECVKLEFYRRVMVPFEEGKRAASGDVFNYQGGDE